MKLSNGDSGSMILNTDTSVFDVREPMNKLVDYENTEAGGSVTINTGVCLMVMDDWLGQYQHQHHQATDEVLVWMLVP